MSVSIHSDVNSDAIRAAEGVQDSLIGMGEQEIAHGVNNAIFLSDPIFGRGAYQNTAAFYAPFDWVNVEADIVLIGITPGRQQAEVGLVELRRCLLLGLSMSQALASAKATASFAGSMRGVASQLMDHFRINTVLKLDKSSDLFGSSSRRVHYTSAFRYPVLESKGSIYKNYSGGKFQSNPLLMGMVEKYLVPELTALPDAWLIPFGPTPAGVLEMLAKRGEISGKRLLCGLNHPSGEQWNRHNCQLDRVDHARCAPNVGCNKIQAKSGQLRRAVASHLS